MKRFVRIWISALGLYFAASVPNWAQTTEQAPPLVGEPMAQVQQSGFFRWFALEKTNHHSTSGHVVTFRPSGARFHSLVRVEASVEGDREKISRLDLVLERSFIDSSSNGVFANDIAKSFLRAAAPQSDIATELADEIEGAETAGQPFLSSGRHTPQQPAEPSLGFLTFLGRRGSYVFKDDYESVSLQNSTTELRISGVLLAGARLKASPFLGVSRIQADLLARA